MDKLSQKAKGIYAYLLADYNMGMKLPKMEYCGELFDWGVVAENMDGELWFFPHVLEEEEEEQEI